MGRLRVAIGDSNAPVGASVGVESYGSPERWIAGRNDPVLFSRLCEPASCGAILLDEKPVYMRIWECGMKGLIEQFLKFGVVGAIAFLIDYGVLMLLSQVIGMDPVISASISFVVSVVFNYVASMHYVFTRRDDISRRREFTIFVILSAIGLVINEIIMVIGVNVLGDSALMVTITKLVATAIVMVWNFVSRKKWLDAGDSAE